jgi:inner membrane protein
MMGITHIGIVLLLIRFLKLNLNSIQILILSIFSIVPDIDFSRSELGMIFKPISYKLEEEFGHRSITHSILFILISFLISFPFSNFYSTLILLAIGSHLILDMLTYSGVKLLWPLNHRFVIFDGPVITGSALDYLIGLSSIILFLFV